MITLLVKPKSFGAKIKISQVYPLLNLVEFTLKRENVKKKKNDVAEEDANTV